MRVLDQPAFVLHVRPWRETSLLVEALTRDHGRVGLVARGVSGPKRHVLRAALQPLQYLCIDYLPCGELARLLQAEALDAAPLLHGDALLAAFYVNELWLRLTPRNDAAPLAFALYGRVRAELAAGGSLAWTLRRGERDLLAVLGYGLALDRDADGDPVQAASRYRLEPAQGPVRDRQRAAGSVSGAALLALAHDCEPAPELLAELRPALRSVLASHLPGGLKSWELLGEMQRLRSPRQE